MDNVFEKMVDICVEKENMRRHFCYI